MSPTLLAQGLESAQTATRKSGDREHENTVIDEKIHRPGTVKINVTGAFIIEEGSTTPQPQDEDGPLHETKDIRLPHHTSIVSHVAVDIGGSLAKLVYFSREVNSNELGGRLNFLKFETNRIEQCLHYINELKTRHQALNNVESSDLCVIATGGGAYKYYDRMREILKVEVLREDEMECLIIGNQLIILVHHVNDIPGLNFFITEIPEETFTYSDADDIRFAEPKANPYPYLLVNIGSGVSMVKVSGPREYERIGGTSLGGGTLWGLLSLLTGARTFDAMLELAEKGDNAAVDMLVGDIYGADYGKIGLKSNAIASSFGKVFKMKRKAEADAEDGGGLSNGDRAEAGRKDNIGLRFAPEDISRSLLYAIRYTYAYTELRC